MKKTTTLMLALLFSGAMLLGEAINTTTRAQEEIEVEGGLKCNQLTGCTGTSVCGGQGEGSNCILDCADGAHIHCARAQ